MKNFVKPAIGLLTLCFTHIAAANSITMEQVKEQLKSGIERIKSTNKKNWAFELYSYESEEGEITEFTAKYAGLTNQTSPWLLLTLNGQPATDKQARKFSKQQQENKDSINLGIRELIDLDTIKVLSNSKDQVQLGFSVNIARLGDEAKKHLQGTLIMYPNSHFISQIDIHNTGPFSPVTFSTLDKFAMQLRFIEVNDRVLPKQAELNMQGTFAGFIEIEETSKDIYSNYQFVGQDQTKSSSAD